METTTESIELLIAEIIQKTKISELQARQSFELVIDFMMHRLLVSDDADERAIINSLLAEL